MENLRENIIKLKEKKNAVILAHNYQVNDVQLIADHLGDSLQLSRLAAEVDNPLIVFCGVKFMAETAKILSPEKTVLLPRLDAGCPMADMLTVDDLLYLKEKHPNARIVTYVNSNADIKAVSDACCTSSNAVQVVANIDSDEIIFVPDKNLGAYVQTKVPGKKIILFEGYCYVHNRIKKEEIEETKREHPDAEIIVHPENRMEVIEIADKVLSTGGMLKYASESDKTEFIVGTEQGLLERMKRENPKKNFYPAFRPKLCQNMKRTSLEDVWLSLEQDKYKIEIDPETSERAKRSLNAMLKYL